MGLDAGDCHLYLAFFFPRFSHVIRGIGVRQIVPDIDQGLKPAPHVVDLIGPAEAVPLLRRRFR